MSRPRLPLSSHSPVTAAPYISVTRDGKGRKQWQRIPKGEPVPRVGVRWRATCRYRALDGKTRQASAWASTKTKATKLLLERLAGRLQANLERSSLSFERAARGWLEEFKQVGKVRPQTLARYEDYLVKYLLPAMGDLLLSEVTTGSITGNLNQIAAHAPSAARHCRIILKHVFSYAVQNDLVSHNPVEGTPTYRSQALPPEALTIDDLRQIRLAVKAWVEAPTVTLQRSRVALDLFDFMLGTGCRTGEALAVRWEDVSFTPAQVAITGTVVTVKGKTVRQAFTKTTAGLRIVSLPAHVAARLQELAGVSDPECPFVFPARGGGVISPNNWRRTLRDALKDTPYAGFTPYKLRKTAATLIAREMSLEAASATLGHSDTAVTKRHYAQRQLEAPDTSSVLQSVFAQL